jgi:hypothetical protein
MKKAELLEEMVRTRDTIYANAITQQGNWSKYPDYFRVIGLTHDGKHAKIRAVRADIYDYLIGDNNEYIRDEDGKRIPDSRPIRERIRFGSYGSEWVVPFRVIAKCDTPTEQQFVEAKAQEEEQRVADQIRWEKEAEHRNAITDALKDALQQAIGLDPYGVYGGGVHLTIDEMEKLTEVLTYARQKEQVG